MPIDAGQKLPDAAVMDLKAAVRRAREAAGLSQDELAAATGIDQSRISRISDDTKPQRPTLDELLRIEEACGEAAGYLLAAAGLISPEGVQAGARARKVAARKGTVR